MKLNFAVVGSFAVLVAVSLDSALADPPPASFEIDFSGKAAIWNPFMGFSACEDLGGVSGCLEIHNAVCDGGGRCICDAEFSFSGSGLSGSTTGPCTAKASCNSSAKPNMPVCKAALRFDTDGAITGPGVSCDATIRGSVTGPVDPSGFYDGRGNAKVALNCNGQRESEGVKGAFQYDVHPPTPWTLSAQITRDGKKLSGTATDDLGFSYTAKGSYDERKDNSKLTFTGEKGTVSKGAKVQLKNLVTMGSSVTGGTANISVQGNKSTVEIGP